MYASYNGHKDVAIALAERGADLNIKNKVSDCQLYIHDDDDDDDDVYDGYYDFIYHSRHFHLNIYIFMCFVFVSLCVCVWMGVCLC